MKLFIWQLLLIGPHVAELLSYLWHRFIRHEGVHVRFVGEIARARHVHHHKRAYPPGNTESEEYKKSCEIDFYFVASAYLVMLVLLSLSGVLSWSSGAGLFVGALGYAVFVLNGFHTLYHLKIEQLVGMRVFHIFPWSFRVILWLKQCHTIGHHEGDGNYFIGPFGIVIEILFRTFIRPGTYDPNDKSQRRRTRFPNFDNKKIRGCENA